MIAKLVISLFCVVLFWVLVLVVACAFHSIDNWIAERRIKALRKKLSKQ